MPGVLSRAPSCSGVSLQGTGASVGYPAPPRESGRSGARGTGSGAAGSRGDSGRRPGGSPADGPVLERSGTSERLAAGGGYVGSGAGSEGRRDIVPCQGDEVAEGDPAKLGGGTLGYHRRVPYLITCTAPFETAKDAADALERAFVLLAPELFVTAPLATGPTPTFDELRASLDRPRIKLSSWSDPSGRLKIPAQEWNRFELEMNLRQVEVLILALRTRTLAASKTVELNPTQQSGYDAAGILDDKRWVLEAFGGVDVTNNQKLKKELMALSGAEAQLRFFACRSSALKRDGEWVASTGRGSPSVRCRVVDGGSLKLVQVEA